MEISVSAKLKKINPTNIAMFAVRFSNSIKKVLLIILPFIHVQDKLL